MSKNTKEEGINCPDCNGIGTHHPSTATRPRMGFACGNCEGSGLISRATYERQTDRDHYECREEDDRWHHAWHTADSLCVDIYKNGEVVVLVKIGDNMEILQCGTITTSHNDRNA